MKRQSKADKEAAQKAALRQRIRDMVAGACGEDPDDDQFFMTMEPASRLLPALEKTFGKDGNGYLWRSHCLDRYENVDSITEFLFQNGVRA